MSQGCPGRGFLVIDGRKPEGMSEVDRSAIAREARRLHLRGRDLLTVIAPSIEGFDDILRPDRAAVCRRLARKLSSEAELIARWLDEEPGARLLAARYG